MAVRPSSAFGIFPHQATQWPSRYISPLNIQSKRFPLVSRQGVLHVLPCSHSISSLAASMLPPAPDRLELCVCDLQASCLEIWGEPCGGRAKTTGSPLETFLSLLGRFSSLYCLPRVSYMCKVNVYSTAHALLLHEGLFIHPLKSALTGH